MPYVSSDPGGPSTLGWVQLAVAAVPAFTKLLGKKKRKKRLAAAAAAEAKRAADEAAAAAAARAAPPVVARRQAASPQALGVSPALIVGAALAAVLILRK